MTQPRNRNAREEQSNDLTIADLAEAIEKRRVVSRREGDDYVLRAADVRRLHTQKYTRHEERQDVPQETLHRGTLEMGRSA